MREYMDAKGCYKMKQLIESGAFEGLMVINNTQEQLSNLNMPNFGGFFDV